MKTTFKLMLLISAFLFTQLSFATPPPPFTSKPACKTMSISRGFTLDQTMGSIYFTVFLDADKTGPDPKVHRIHLYIYDKSGQTVYYNMQEHNYIISVFGDWFNTATLYAGDYVVEFRTEEPYYMDFEPWEWVQYHDVEWLYVDDEEYLPLHDR